MWYNIIMSDSGKKMKLPVGWENDDFSILSSLRAEKESWQERESEGQLSVDVAQTDTELVIVATMAGTPPEKIELHLNNDLLTIRGERTPPVEASASYFYQESFWGKFSRTIAACKCQIGNGFRPVQKRRPRNQAAEI